MSSFTEAFFLQFDSYVTWSWKRAVCNSSALNNFHLVFCVCDQVSLICLCLKLLSRISSKFAGKVKKCFFVLRIHNIQLNDFILLHKLYNCWFISIWKSFIVNIAHWKFSHSIRFSFWFKWRQIGCNFFMRVIETTTNKKCLSHTWTVNYIVFFILSLSRLNQRIRKITVISLIFSSF